MRLRVMDVLPVRHTRLTATLSFFALSWGLLLMWNRFPFSTSDGGRAGHLFLPRKVQGSTIEPSVAEDPDAGSLPSLENLHYTVPDPLALHLHAASGNCIGWAEPSIPLFSQNFTIEIWFRTQPDALSQGPPSTPFGLFSNVRIDNEEERHTQYYGRHFQVLLDDTASRSNGTVLVLWMAKYSEVSGALRSKKIVTDGLWHHIAVRRDKRSQSVSLFVDFVLEGSTMIPNGIDMESQDQPCVIGGCFNRRYRECDIASIRIWKAAVPESLFSSDVSSLPQSFHAALIGDFLFLIDDPIFLSGTAASAWVSDRSPTGNDAVWAGLPQPATAVTIQDARTFPGTETIRTLDALMRAVRRGRSNPSSSFDVAHRLSPSLDRPQSNLVLTSLLSGGHGSQALTPDKDKYYGFPHYFVNLGSDCRRLRLPCVFVYDSGVVSDEMAAMLNSAYTLFYAVDRSKPPIWRGRAFTNGSFKVAVGRRFVHFLSYLDDHPQVEYALHLDARDSRINADPFSFLVRRANECDLVLQHIGDQNGAFCGGMQSGKRSTVVGLFQRMAEAMEASEGMDDQAALNVVLKKWEDGGPKKCGGKPFINHQQARHLGNPTPFILHGNWFSDVRRIGRRDGDPE